MRKTRTIRVPVLATLLLWPLPVGCGPVGPSAPSPPRSREAKASITSPAPAPQLLSKGKAKAKRARTPTGAALSGAED